MRAEVCSPGERRRWPPTPHHYRWCIGDRPCHQRFGIREIKRFGGPDIAVLIWDAIDKRQG
jgi:hypothetical protein